MAISLELIASFDYVSNPVRIPLHFGIEWHCGSTLGGHRAGNSCSAFPALAASPGLSESLQ